ncbi:MAG TPA: hypothetical protein VNC41_18205 [Acidimicrobiia bacterium]|nr:hypothetical protein [Acidimicrobiia bacterium]
MQDTEPGNGYSAEWLLRRIVGVALLGAAFVHFAAAPPHLDAEFRHGLFFVAIGWAQFLLGVFLLAKPRGRAYLVTTAAINLAIVFVWIVSRTAGIDGPAETVGFGDALSVVLEVITIAGAFALGTPALHRARIARGTGRAIFSGATCIVAGAFVFALSGGLATGDDHVHVGAEGDSHAHSDGAHEHGNPAMGEPGHDHAAMLRNGAEHEHAAGEAHESDATDSEHAHDSSDPTHAASHNDGDSSHAHDTSSGGSAAAASHGHGGTSSGPAHAHSGGNTDTTHGSSHAHGNTGGTTGTTHSHGAGTSPTTHNHGGNGGTTPTTHNHGGNGGTTPTTHNHGTPTWEETRKAALIGGVSTATYNSRMAAIGAHLADQIRSRSDFLQSLSSAEREARIKTYVDWTLEHALDAEHGIGNHAHGPQQWISMDDATTNTLNQQLAQAATVIPEFPTAAHAMAAGYMQVTPWMPGIGAHYLNVGYLFAFEPENPAFLLYNGNSPSSVLVGVSHALLAGPTAPAGFAGPNDTWHEHPALCLIGGTFVIGADNTPKELCESVGGTKSNGFFGNHLWMMHLWQVPGWSSSWGLMSGESPAINLARTDIR